MLDIGAVSRPLGIWSDLTLVVCVVYGLPVPESLHMHALLEQLLPAFKWLTRWGFLQGLVESVLYGVYAGLPYVPIYNHFKRRWDNGRLSAASDRRNRIGCITSQAGLKERSI